MLAMWMSTYILHQPTYLTHLRYKRRPMQNIRLCKWQTFENCFVTSQSRFSKKMVTQEVFAKNGGVHVGHVEKPPVFPKKNVFCDNPGCPIL